MVHILRRAARRQFDVVDPAPSDDGIYSARILIGYLVLLFALPALLVVGALGSAGTPANLVALGGAYAWFWFHVHRSDPHGDVGQRVRMAALLFLLGMCVVYAHGMTRPISPGEVTSADSGMLRIFAWCGVLLLAADGVRTYGQLYRLLRMLGVASGLVACLAVTQFVTGQTWVDRIHIPGLTMTGEIFGLADRNGLPRAAATATSPIELGVLMAMILPILITVALSTDNVTRRAGYWMLTLLVSVVIFLSISRSALMSAAVGIACLAPVWSPPVRRWAALFGVAVMGLVYVVVPGLLGSLGAMFVGVQNDPSVLSRTDSYDYALTFVERSPILGRGFATFLPQYRILDNQYLLFLVDAGVVGVGLFLVLVYTAVTSARKAARSARTPRERQVAQALVATIAAGACGALFFDAFSFPMVTGVLFMSMGLCGAISNLTGVPVRDAEGGS